MEGVSRLQFCLSWQRDVLKEKQEELQYNQKMERVFQQDLSNFLESLLTSLARFKAAFPADAPRLRIVEKHLRNQSRTRKCEKEESYKAIIAAFQLVKSLVNGYEAGCLPAIVEMRFSLLEARVDEIDGKLTSRIEELEEDLYLFIEGSDEEEKENQQADVEIGEITTGGEVDVDGTGTQATKMEPHEFEEQADQATSHQPKPDAKCDGADLLVSEEDLLDEGLDFEPSYPPALEMNELADEAPETEAVEELALEPDVEQEELLNINEEIEMVPGPVSDEDLLDEGLDFEPSYPPAFEMNELVDEAPETEAVEGLALEPDVEQEELKINEKIEMVPGPVSEDLLDEGLEFELSPPPASEINELADEEGEIQVIEKMDTITPPKDEEDLDDRPDVVSDIVPGLMSDLVVELSEAPVPEPEDSIDETLVEEAPAPEINDDSGLEPEPEVEGVVFVRQFAVSDFNNVKESGTAKACNSNDLLRAELTKVIKERKDAERECVTVQAKMKAFSNEIQKAAGAV
ncbi:hypothetical protein BSKO_12414 [Bryopsis sp. KO-2023]|nr:hypothetical protein BSKO_12414 [Bryopsis sp. KO-2023]